MTDEGGKFGGLMEKSMNTLSGMMTSFKNLIDITLGAFTEGIFNSIKETLPTVTMMLKDNLESFREFGVILGKIFSTLLNALVGAVEWFEKLDKATKAFIGLLTGAGGLVVALQIMMRVMGSVFGVGLTLFSPTGAFIAAVTLLVTALGAVVGKMKQAETEARKIHDRVMAMIKEEQIAFIEAGRWEMVPGMTEGLSQIASMNRNYESVLETAKQIVSIRKQLELGKEWQDLANKPGFLNEANRAALTLLRKNMLSTIDVTKDWLEEFPDLMDKAIEDGTSVGGMRVFHRYMDTLRQHLNSPEFGAFLDDIVSKMDVFTANLEEQVKIRNELIAQGASTDTIDSYNQKIESMFNKYQTEYLPLFNEILAVMEGSEEAGADLIERITSALAQQQPMDSIKHWWDWLSERLNVALSEFKYSDNTSEIKYSGKAAAEAYIEGFTGSLEDAHILSSLIEDEGQYYAEIAKRQMEDIFGILVDMFGQASREQIPMDEWFETADESVKALVKEYMRLRDIVESVKKTGNDWIDDWLKGFQKLKDGYDLFTATYRKEEENNITAVVEHQRMIAQRNAKEVLDENMGNFDRIQTRIKEVYGIELASKEQLYSIVRKWIDAQYDYEAALIVENAKIREISNRAELLSLRAQDANHDDKMSMLAEEYRLRLGIIETTLSGSDLELEKLKLKKWYIDQEMQATEDLIQSQNKYFELLKRSLRVSQDSTKSLDERLKYIDEYYEMEKNRLTTILSGQALTVSLAEAELDKRREIIDAYNKQYEVMLRGDQEYWDQVRRNIVQAQSEGKTGRALAGQAGLAAEGTEIGNMISGGDPLLAIVDAISTAVMNIENLNAVLNPFTTIVEGMVSVVEPFVNSVLAPFVDTLKVIGALLGAFSAILVAVNIPLQVLRIVLGILAEVMKWFYNKVMLPVGNAIIDAINFVVTMINNLLGTNIALIERLRPLMDNIDEYSDALREQADSLTDTLSFLERKLKDEVDAQIDSLQDLYEVGAISSTEYESQVKAIMRDWGPYFQSAAEQMYGDLNDPQSIVDAILEVQKQLESVNAHLDAIRSGGTGTGGTDSTDRRFKPMYASGSSSIPSDMDASIHRGEMIIPNSFASAIRRGDITIGGPGGSGGASVNIYVGGSVIEERNLARSIADVIEQERSRGHM
jgi:hypothetical protein